MTEEPEKEADVAHQETVERAKEENKRAAEGRIQEKKPNPGHSV